MSKYLITVTNEHSIVAGTDSNLEVQSSAKLRWQKLRTDSSEHVRKISMTNLWRRDQSSEDFSPSQSE